MRDIMDIVKPRSDARYVVFYSFSEGAAGGGYYDVHGIDNMRHQLTILAYEMNGAPLSVLHGAPLRLRCENELGFKMVKWVAAIEFVRDFADLGAGQGGYNEGPRVLRLPHAHLRINRDGPSAAGSPSRAVGRGLRPLGLGRLERCG